MNNIKEGWQRENSTAGSPASLADVTFSHPLDVVRTRFLVNDGRIPNLPTYKSTPHALHHCSIRGSSRPLCRLLSGCSRLNDLLGSLFLLVSAMFGLYLRSREELSPGLHLASAAEAGALQRPSTDGIPRYMDRWHIMKGTARFEGLRGFYRGITSNLLKNVPAASLTFIVYENVLNMLKLARRE